ncbi:hypothetical protein HCN44_006011 [Aphidius gifuensis]|uniref:Uncharacterized protein n=2 Tax=Aphidius gifuensis TaxID=684658 RepID=A0A834Y174_APHGI|nr:hypothetical protein HCN44_006011 [Aphidius gifuensis]
MDEKTKLLFNTNNYVVLKTFDNCPIFDPDGLIQLLNKRTHEVTSVELDNNIVKTFNLAVYMSDENDNNNDKASVPNKNIENYQGDEYIDEEYLDEEFLKEQDESDSTEVFTDVNNQPSTSSGQLYHKKKPQAKWNNSADLALLALFKDNKKDYFGTSIRKKAV